ncbi:MAG: carbamoyl-phosphate synthase large subunit, partial [Kiritimatiellae bacterium]|nr:carbamoyl-phosphate synthase large subunit [Kiritimatiellia bacterium]
VARAIGSWPLVVRPGFTLGGTGGGIARDAASFDALVARGLAASPTSEVLVEECLEGWKEFEMEVMRDRAGNAVVVCSIENLDPMGVHTGDSITVAPIQTLTDREYQAMRDDSIRVLEKVGVATGGSNVQWAVNPKDGRRVIIEMNPRVSRSSALASKATGFPIAKIAALLAVGYTLDELPNDITKKTPACFEPALDYVVVKVPRFAFEKFPGADIALGTQMKSVGEAMAIGRTFKQAWCKAVRSLEAPLRYHDLSRFDPWFRRELSELAAFKVCLGKAGKTLFAAAKRPNHRTTQPPNHPTTEPPNHPTDLLRQAKVFGLSDAEIAQACGVGEEDVRARRIALGVRPEFRAVDTCAGEFEADTPYYYSSYGWDSPAVPAAPAAGRRRKILVLGGGPNRIGQGIEFDWCCCHAAFALRERGFEVVMMNSNPETVSTDYDTSDRLYFEPLTFEDVMEVYEREGCDGAIVQLGGQTPLNLAARLEAAGVKILGTSPADIARAEDRDFFRALVEEAGVKQPPSGIAHTVEEARAVASRLGYPVLVRPSFVLGGRAMAIVSTPEELEKYAGEAVAAAAGKPILVDKFLDHAVELDVDCVADGTRCVVGAILEHVEAAGCHSGDAAAVTPPRSLSPEVLAEVERIARVFADRLHVVGLMNIQLAVRHDEVWMIEVNPRASRTVPFVSKATGIPLADVASRVMAGETLDGIGLASAPLPPYHCVKEAVFPFARFPGADVALTPEMKSTGEVMAIDADPEIAYFKSQVAAGSPLPKGGDVFVSLRDEDKSEGVELAKELVRLGYGICATLGTSTALWGAGVESKAVFRISRGRPNALDLLRKRAVGWIVSTAETGHEATADNARLRTAATAAGVPLTTTLAGFRAAVAGLAENGPAGETAVRSLQEWHALLARPA